MNYERRQISETLLKIDEEASLTLGNTGMRFPVIIVGGSAFILRDLTNRPMTHDIDVLYSDEKLRDILQNYHAVNSAVMAYMDSVPHNFEDRLVQIDLETKAVDYYTPPSRILP